MMDADELWLMKKIAETRIYLGELESKLEKVQRQKASAMAEGADDGRTLLKG